MARHGVAWRCVALRVCMRVRVHVRRARQTPSSIVQRTPYRQIRSDGCRTRTDAWVGPAQLKPFSLFDGSTGEQDEGGGERERACMQIADDCASAVRARVSSCTAPTFRVYRGVAWRDASQVDSRTWPPSPARVPAHGPPPRRGGFARAMPPAERKAERAEAPCQFPLAASPVRPPFAGAR